MSPDEKLIIENFKLQNELKEMLEKIEAKKVANREIGKKLSDLN